MKRYYIALAMGFCGLVLLPIAAREPLAARIAHSDPSKYRHSPAVHGGPGFLDFTALFDAHTLEPNLQFLHRGVIQPKSGIGAHFHNQCEEMFVILDGEAQFTIDGRTSLLKGPAGAPCRLGHSHAIYNPTDKPVQWLNINVSMFKDQYDAFNLNDPRLDVPLDPIPQFITMRLDRALLRPVNAMNGGKGTVQYRRALDPSIFQTSWAYVDHLVLPPGTLHRPAHASRGRGVLFRDEGFGNSDRRGRARRRRNRPDQRRRRRADSVGRSPLVREYRQRTLGVHDRRRGARHEQAHRQHRCRGWPRRSGQLAPKRR